MLSLVFYKGNKGDTLLQNMVFMKVNDINKVKITSN